MGIFCTGASFEDFKLHKKAIKFRLQQGFFDLASDLMEDILLKSGNITVKPNGSKHMELVSKKTGKINYLDYSEVRTQFRLAKNMFAGQVNINITDSQFYIDKKCRLTITGPLQFRLIVQFSANGKTLLSMPQDFYDDASLNIRNQGCGIAKRIAIRFFVRNTLFNKIKEAFDKVFNGTEISVQNEFEVGNRLEGKNVKINMPFDNLEPNQAPGNESFSLLYGLRAYLSNQSANDYVRVFNPRSKYVNEMGFDWAFDTGFLALSQNIYDPDYVTAHPKNEDNFLEWGKAPKESLGKKVDFDAALQIKESVIRSLFETLYQAGLLNIQMSESDVKDSTFTLNPYKIGYQPKFKLPNGKVIKKDDFENIFVQFNVKSVPKVSLENPGSIFINISQFELKYFIKAKNIEEPILALHFTAKFDLEAFVEVSSDGTLSLKTNESPLTEFSILSRNGISDDISNQKIEKDLNKFIVELVQDLSFEIPLMQNRGLEIKYIGINKTSEKGSSNDVLSVYFGVN